MPSLADRGRPFLTFYDDATGERTELSYATFDNWVAKTANLLRDGLDAGPGDAVAVLLPAHWQTVVVSFAVWAAGAEVREDGDVAFVPEETLPLTGKREVVGLSLRPLGAPLSRAWPGVTDYADVASYGDSFAPMSPLPATAPSDARVLVADEDPVPYALAAYAGGGGVVVVRNADPALLARKREVERAR